MTLSHNFDILMFILSAGQALLKSSFPITGKIPPLGKLALLLLFSVTGDN